MSSYDSTLAEEIIYEFAHDLNWTAICSKGNLTPSFIEKYSDFIDFSALCKHQELPADILRKFINNVDWNEISKACPSEEILREFAHKIKWAHIDPYDYAFPYEIMSEFRRYLTTDILLS